MFKKLALSTAAVTLTLLTPAHASPVSENQPELSVYCKTTETGKPSRAVGHFIKIDHGRTLVFKFVDGQGNSEMVASLEGQCEIEPVAHYGNGDANGGNS